MRGQVGTGFLVAMALGLLTARCGTEGKPCNQGDPNCTCTQQNNGSVNCRTDSQCEEQNKCGDMCCSSGQRCDQGTCVVDSNQCIYIPGPGEFEAPERHWWWPYEDAGGKKRRDIEMPDYDQVMSTPVVVRLHGAAGKDEAPAVIFNTYKGGGTASVQGVLRAVKGDTGEPLWTVTDPALRTNGVGSPAAGDLDGDGDVEIVTGAWDGTSSGSKAGLLAFRSDGTLFWKRPDLFVGWGGPAIADLDNDGKPEVVVGNVVLDGATGNVRCDGGYTDKGDNGVGPLSAIVDMDGDGKLEIVAGNMSYRLEKDAQGNDVCKRLWGTPKDKAGNPLPDGFPAVGDIYEDPAVRTTIGKPEIAVVSRGTLRVVDWTGGLVMNPVPLPGGGFGGPPTIADFDGDGKAEIGVAGLGSYTVFKPGRPGNILWSVVTQDASSSTTGSSVFDFDGNGRAEAVYADECFVHVFDGPTGMEVFQAPNSSCTAYEMPVVADVDGDGAAELLVPANNRCSISCPWGTHELNGFTGLQLFKSPSDAWVGSRPVWNQHTYHVTNVGDLGEIPQVEERSWGPNTKNSFRLNYQGTGTFAAPNLVVTKTELDGNQCPASLTMVATVSNIGARAVRAGMPVAFYEQKADGTRELLGSTTIDTMIKPGESAQARLEWKGPPRLNPASVVVVADDDGTGLKPKGSHKECNENDNVLSLDKVECREAG